MNYNDIKLPPLPPLYIAPSVQPVDYPEVAQALIDYARSAVEADRQRRGEPVGWQYYQDGKWWHGDDRIKDHRKNTEEAGYPIREVYAAPQPAEQQTTPDVEALVEALDITELRDLLLILRRKIGGAMWTLDDEEEELAVRTEKAIDAIEALAAHRKQGGEV